jgi:hypothetical protein
MLTLLKLHIAINDPLNNYSSGRITFLVIPIKIMIFLNWASNEKKTHVGSSDKNNYEY